ncbi:MAG: hypothetical protein Q7U68_00980 [Candidatus Roizmanbacteria bacterium]|nr:hypothetical protein [Candidatus Roizmanbacteria bacterium]
MAQPTHIPKSEIVPTQQFVAIDEIRDGIIILKNKGLRAVAMASSLNFELKSSEEQEAIIGGFGNFLNSLDFSVQFFIHSRKLNIEDYLDYLKSRLKEETNELLRIQIDEYTEFVKSFVETTDIMSKTFFVVIPYSAGGAESVSAGITGILKPPKTTAGAVTQEKFQEAKNQLLQRVQYVIAGLGKMEIRTVQLETKELIELFFNLYNPEQIENKKLKILEELPIEE